jgi:oligogalacturonide lyase
MIGREFHPEKRNYRDSKTGLEVTQLTQGDSNNYIFYFTDNSFTTGDREIYFMSDRSAVRPEIFNVFKMELATGQITQVTAEPGGVTTHAHTKTPDSEIIVYVTGNQLKKVNTRTGRVEVLYEEKPEVLLGAPFISPDKKYVGVPRNENVSISQGANYSGFKEIMFATKKGWITLFDLQTGQTTDVYEDTHLVGHFQFAPDDSTIAMYCHEGPWNLVQQRIWILDTVKRDVQPCFRQTEVDCVGHEFWTRDGLIFFDNRRSGHDGTITSSKSQATIATGAVSEMPYVGLADRRGRILRRINMPFYCNHYHANNDNTILVGDEVEDLVLIDIREDVPQLRTLCTHNTSWYKQQTHCHPTFNWQGDQVLFTSDRDGKCNLYLVKLEQLKSK